MTTKVPTFTRETSRTRTGERRRDERLPHATCESVPAELSIMQDGLLRCTNPLLQKPAGATWEELHGRVMLDLVHRDDRKGSGAAVTFTKPGQARRQHIPPARHVPAARAGAAR